MRFNEQAIRKAWPLLILIAGTCAAGAEPPDVLPEAVPDCSVAVNGAGQTDIEPGLPVVIEAFTIVPGGDASVTPTVEVHSSGKLQTWPLERVALPESDTGDERQLIWMMKPEATRQLPSGEYSVAVTLKEKDQTLIQSAPAVIRISPSGAGKVGDEARFRIRLRYELVGGNSHEAANIATAWLAKQPRSIEALLALGDLAAGSGALEPALQFYRRALERWGETAESAVEPPVAILARQSAVLRAIAGESTGPGTVPGVKP